MDEEIKGLPLIRYCHYCGNKMEIPINKNHTLLCSEACQLKHHQNMNLWKIQRRMLGVKVIPEYRAQNKKKKKAIAEQHEVN